jgi:hypothetical protein
MPCELICMMPRRIPFITCMALGTSYAAILVLIGRKFSSPSKTKYLKLPVFFESLHSNVELTAGDVSYSNGIVIFTFLLNIWLMILHSVSSDLLGELR